MIFRTIIFLIALLNITSVVADSGSPPALAEKSGPGFWSYWGDGLAEVNTYQGTIERYGELRSGKATLIFVTETVSNKTWIKDDAGNLPAHERVSVMKLNAITDFKTGVYDYHTMTSVFSPVNVYDGAPPFSPRKIAATVSEWCGHVFQQLFPKPGAMTFRSFSYFGEEGEVEYTRKHDGVSIDRDEKKDRGSNESASSRSGKVSPRVLYYDALPILFRHLSEVSHGVLGKTSEKVQIVPSLWWGRKAHLSPVPIDATIKFAKHADKQQEYEYQVSFVKKTSLAQVPPDSVWTFAATYPHRLKRVKMSDGQVMTLVSSKRLPYWSMKSDKHP